MKRVVWIVAVLTLGACGPEINVQPLNPSPHPLSRRSPAEVQVFTSAIPERPYIEIALISASKGQAEDHLGAIRERAAEVGCDALIFTALPRTNTSEGFVNGRYAATSTTSGSAATCVVWNDAPAGPPGAP